MDPFFLFLFFSKHATSRLTSTSCRPLHLRAPRTWSRPVRADPGACGHQPGALSRGEGRGGGTLFLGVFSGLLSPGGRPVDKGLG